MNRWTHWALASISVVLLPACASLPDLAPNVTLVSAAVMAQGPTVTGSKGAAVAPRASRSLLTQRWKNSYADLAALARVEEVITSEPLIAGNKLTLLYDGPQTMAAMVESIRGARDHINLPPRMPRTQRFACGKFCGAGIGAE